MILILVILPSTVSAHTHLKDSNPSEGQVVVGELSELTLTFDGNIEKLSSMKVVKDGSELIEIQVQIDAARMLGVLTEPLGNGAYNLQWSIAGEDGHPITGEINFTVQREQNATPTEQGQVITESSEENRLDVQITASGNVVSEKVDSQIEKKTAEEKSKSNTTMIMTTIGFVIILGIGLMLIRKKK
jgi:copper resistance protein C